MKKEQLHQSKDNKSIPVTSVSSGKGRQVRQDIYYYTDQIVNFILFGKPEDNQWILIDTGMPHSSSVVLSAVKERFGENSKPSAILLTHGHFDHVGGVVDLIKEWNVPVYAHPLEFPYLTGEKSYPAPDPTVEGGLLAKVSFIDPVEPINIKAVLKPLPNDHSVPGMPGWQWIHTPGHSPGHVSFFRDEDKALIAGDAFVTVRQDSLYKVIMQKAEVNGPPRYLTTDWKAAWDSVKKLEALHPEIVVSGHGTAMEGKELTQGLLKLTLEFDTIAIPEHGKYV
ncbi:MBL fold metallo-hydrolase [Sporocytophaga myxococcoides]|uniref:MBL fold metallo-hydrolase n=1 Tax=Sporocytophaga myxococcoides TaxID=153721 RepID=UPI0004094596|nr:MBL fold metallo-hydrolase [Sporocytophaga myxococcoides]